MRTHPECGQAVEALFKRIAGDDRDAYAFLGSFDEYFESVTAFVASDNHNQLDFVALLARTNTVYSLPFFIRNGHFLHLPIQQAFNSLADGLAWRSHPEDWRRQWGEICSLAIVDVIMAVANLKLGFADAREISGKVKEIAWACRDTRNLAKTDIPS